MSTQSFWGLLAKRAPSAFSLLVITACSLINTPDDVTPQLGAAGAETNGGSDGVSGNPGQGGSVAATAGADTGGSAGKAGSPAVGGDAGMGACEGADCGEPGGAGGQPPDAPVRICVPKELLCLDDVATKCSDDGTAYVGDTKCTAAQTCLTGVCEAHQCTPGASFCATGAVRKCSTDGLSSTQTEACGTGKYCDDPTATCKTGTCAPNQPSCDGTRATTCNAQGSGYQAGGTTCGATTTCAAGLCKAHVCTPSSQKCNGKDIVVCAADGLSSSISQSCSATQYCDDSAATAACKAQVCAPGVSVCEGNGVKTCNSQGSASTTTACAGNQFCDGASNSCKAQVCTPNAKACVGNGISTCNAQGSGTTTTACSGTQYCDGASTTCKAQVCTPNAKTCTGNNVNTCNAQGSASSSAACPWPTPACIPANGTCGVNPSCDGLAISCGSTTNDSCCAADVVPAVTNFYRGLDGYYGSTAYPATLSAVRLDRYEVTVGRFRAFVNDWVNSAYRPAAGSGKHSHLNGGSGLKVGAGFETGWQTAWAASIASTQNAWNTKLAGGTWQNTAGLNEELPISLVTWYEAYAFCIWDNGFLPSDAEWGNAASGGLDERYVPWSASKDRSDLTHDVASYWCDTSDPNCFNFMRPVGSKPNGAGKFGHLDLIASVDEWVLDQGDAWFDAGSAYVPYAMPCTDCMTSSTDGYRVTRGGGYSQNEEGLSTNYRRAYLENTRADGMRCARKP